MVFVKHAMSIFGWMSEDELVWLAEQAGKSKRILEVGSHLGRSTSALAINTRGVVYAVDLWQDEKVYRDFMLRKALNVFPVRGDSVTRSTQVAGEFDFIFIDADHSYEAVKADIAAWSKRLAPGGTIAGHDYDAHWPGVMRAVDEAYPGRLRGAGSIWYVRI
jgi:predicted O-methyltransferase YrrM